MHFIVHHTRPLSFWSCLFQQPGFIILTNTLPHTPCHIHKRINGRKRHLLLDRPFGGLLVVFISHAVPEGLSASNRSMSYLSHCLWGQVKPKNSAPRLKGKSVSRIFCCLLAIKEKCQGLKVHQDSFL